MLRRTSIRDGASNPHDEQSPWLRLRARTALAPHGSKGNLTLADPAAEISFQPAGSAAATLVQSVEPAAEKSPDWGNVFCYRAENRDAPPSAWCQATVVKMVPPDERTCVMPRMALSLLVGLTGLSPVWSQGPVVWVASPWQHVLRSTQRSGVKYIDTLLAHRAIPFLRELPVSAVT